MLNINIDIRNSEVFKQYKHILPQCISRALNKAGAGMRTDISKVVREKYTIKLSNFYDAMRVTNASVSRFIYELSSNKDKLSLQKYSSTWTKKAPGATVEIIKGQRRTLAHTFFQDIQNKKAGSIHKGVFIRRGKKRLPIRELTGPGIGTLMTAARVLDTVMPAVPEVFDTELDRLIEVEMKKQEER